MNQLPPKFNVIIVDDNVMLCENLNAYFKANRFNFNVGEICHDFDSALAALKTTKPDLVLLDIELGGRDSFDLISELDHIDFEIIFITGHDEHALSALKFSAIDYLLKPFGREELDLAVNKAIDKLNNNYDLNRYNVLRHNIFQSKKSEHKIIIPESNSYEFVTTREILRCEGWSKYTKVFLIDGRVITSSYNLGHYKKLLHSYSFFHCHKSHIINTTHIKRYKNSGVVEMKDGIEIPVARRKKDEFVNQVIKNNYFFRINEPSTFKE